MITASYLQKQGAKYRELARAEPSLEMRRQLFALAARCDELAAMMARWPGPKELQVAQPATAAAPRRVKSAEPAPDPERPPAPLRVAEGPRARLVHGFGD